MDIDPEIMNRIRAQSDVGSDSITHVHHIPRQRQPSPEEQGEADPPEEGAPDSTKARFSQMMRSIRLGRQGGEDDDQPPS